jgi:hypothetical protein
MAVQRLSDKEQWALLIEEMGYMAQLRNLRNFDNAQIDGILANKVKARLSDPNEVKKSKQLPFRFYSAWLNVKDRRWADTLDTALDLSIPNIPQLDGRTLILIDTSGSMQVPMSDPHDRGYKKHRVVNVATGEEEDVTSKTPNRVDAGALFGLALAMRNPGNVDVFSFASGQENLTKIAADPKNSLLKAVEKFSQRVGMVGHGTDIEGAIRNTYNGQDRVAIFTDMQSMPVERAWPYGDAGDVTRAVPKDKHVYGFDLSGYQNSAMDASPTRHEMGGLTDHTFSAIPQIEAGASGKWPWES